MAQPDYVYIDNNTDSDTVLFAGSNEVQEKQALVLKHRNPYKFILYNWLFRERL